MCTGIGTMTQLSLAIEDASPPFCSVHEPVSSRGCLSGQRTRLEANTSAYVFTPLKAGGSL